MNYFFRPTLLSALANFREGYFELVCPDRTYGFGDPTSSLRAIALVHNERLYRRVVLGGDIGIGEAWMDGDWSSPDVVSVVRVCVRNLAALEGGSRFFGALRSLIDLVRHSARRNTPAGSRRNIGEHYDLSNEFFGLFLDRGMMYSAGYFPIENASLEVAQFEKLDLICRKLQLSPGDRVLEIGAGWGGFAEHASRHYGCRVTTTTISGEQCDYARMRLRDDQRVEVLFEDYRNLTGRYDKIVSIEMFEAVGLAYYDEFFRACDRLLAPDGRMLMQTIAMNERKFPAYRKSVDWIQKYIFPGSELASLSEVLRSLGRVTTLSMHHCEDIGVHYARTLAHWRERFLNASDEVAELGFDARFRRMWDYYLAYCEGAFLERHIGAMQILLTRQRGGIAMFNEPGALACRSASFAR